MPKLTGVQKRRKKSPYVRGDFWLEKRPGREIWYVYSYNRQKRQYEYKSTRTEDEFTAHVFMQRMFLEMDGQSDTFCGYCGQKTADGHSYGVVQAITDYAFEVAEKRVSGEAIFSRLKHVIVYVKYFLKQPDLPCSAAIHDRFVEGFRAWLQPQPIEWKNGKGEVSKTQVRTRSSVEESVHQLRAVLNHAVRQGRSDAVPRFRAFSRQVVTIPVRSRARVEHLTEMLAYAAETERRAGLHRFLIASLCTGGRPDAIYDMNVKEDRYQWHKEERFFDLNPWGRTQTKKFRPWVPVVGVLHQLLLQAEEESPDGWVVHYRGKRVINVRSAWRTMIKDLNYPGGREWGSYLLRRSVASILRESGARSWDVQGLLGHRVAGTTETYAYSTLATTARESIEKMLNEIDQKAPGVLQCKSSANW